MTTQELLPFWRIVEQLREFCANRLTGTVFIVGDDNRMAQIQLDGGNIVMLLCRGRRGLEALAAMRTMISARLRFDGSYMAPAEREVFNTVEVIDQLGLSLAGTAANTVAAAQFATPVPVAVPAATPLSPDGVKALERLLVQAIGPMAQIVCGDLAEEADDLRSLALAMVAEIPDKKHAEAFRIEAAKLLKLAEL